MRTAVRGRVLRRGLVRAVLPVPAAALLPNVVEGTRATRPAALALVAAAASASASGTASAAPSSIAALAHAREAVALRGRDASRKRLTSHALAWGLSLLGP